MWWVGEERLADAAARTISAATVQEVQAWLLDAECARRRRLQRDRRCIDCGTVRDPHSHGPALRCGACAARWRAKVKRVRVSAWLVENECP